jgi:DNA-binding NarL/FixJ family response regulator
MTERPVKGAPIRTFLVDDHPVVIAGARALIEASNDIICVGAAYTGAEALAKVEETAPDVVVVDVLLPDISGLVLVGHLVERGFQGHIVVMTFLNERSYVEQALQTGVKGFIQKCSAGVNLLIAIRSAMLGGLFFDPPTASEILVPSTPPSGPSALGTPLLTTREEEVLRLVAFGYSNKEIAHRTAVSIKSVETYKARAIEKMNLRSRAQIVDFAVKQGWMEPSDEVANCHNITTRQRACGER